MKTRMATGKLTPVKYMEDAGEDSKEDGGGDAVSSEQDYTSDDGPPPVKKRRQSQDKSISANKTRGKRHSGKNVGKLAKLLEMPVDIFCEISVYLEPLDLLRLARSTRGLNSMLMSRDSKPIWRTARNYYPDLPDCPADLSEPEYARLLFERDCHECLTPRVLKVDYVLRARLCSMCRSSHTVKGTQLIETIQDLTEELLRCIPCHNQAWSSHSGRSQEYFYSTRVHALVRRFRTVRPEDRSGFYDVNEYSIRDIVKHAADIEKWFISDRKTRMAEASEAAERRKLSLRSKLIELGHNEDHFPDGWDSEWHQIMEQPRDLTPRIWAAVRPKLEACIEKEKARRDEQDRLSRKCNRRAEVGIYIQEVLRERKKRNRQLCMKFDKALELPSIDALVKDDDYRQEITREKWDAAWVKVEKEMDEYADQVRKDLTKLIIVSRQVAAAKMSSFDSAVQGSPESSPSHNGTDAGVDLAFLVSPHTFFECGPCSTLLGYPALLDHTHIWTSKWNIWDFAFGNATKIAHSLLSSVETQQHDDMASLGKRLQCLRCDENISQPKDWSEMVNHFKFEQEWYERELQRQQDTPSSTIALHNDHALDRAGSRAFTVLDLDASATQKAKVRSWTYGHPSIYTCGLCKWYCRKTQQEVALHIRSKHLKDPPKEGDIVEGRYRYAFTHLSG